jgi:hypothetical protein
MGFPISQVLGAALPAITSGNWGGAIQAGASAAITAYTTPKPSYVPQTSGGATPTATGGATPAGTTVAVMQGAALVRWLLAKAANFLGRKVTKRAVLDLIRRYGPTAAASALGWSAVEAVQFWMAAEGAGKPRRRRGLSYRQLANAKRVARTLQGMTRTFQQACGAVGYGRRRSSGGGKRCKR